MAACFAKKLQLSRSKSDEDCTNLRELCPLITCVTAWFALIVSCVFFGIAYNRTNVVFESKICNITEINSTSPYVRSEITNCVCVNTCTYRECSSIDTNIVHSGQCCGNPCKRRGNSGINSCLFSVNLYQDLSISLISANDNSQTLRFTCKISDKCSIYKVHDSGICYYQDKILIGFNDDGVTKPPQNNFYFFRDGAIVTLVISGILFISFGIWNFFFRKKSQNASISSNNV